MLSEATLLEAEAAAERGRTEEAAAALAAGGPGRGAAMLWAQARWAECQGQLSLARQQALATVSQAPGAPEVEAVGWLAAARLSTLLGEPKRALDYLERAAERSPDEWGERPALLAVGHARVALLHGDMAQAHEALDGLPPGAGLASAEAALLRGALAVSEAQPEATQHFIGAAELCQRHGLAYLVAEALTGATEAALEAGQPQNAEGWLAQAQGHIEAYGYRRLGGHMLRLRGWLLQAQRDYPGAIAAYVEALRTFIMLEDRLGVACTDLCFGAMLVREPSAGDPRRGNFLLEEARGIFERAGAATMARRVEGIAGQR